MKDHWIHLATTVILGLMTASLAREASSKPARSIEELIAVLDQAGRQIVAERMWNTGGELSHQQKTLSDWSLPELDAVTGHWREKGEHDGVLFYWGPALIEQSAFLDEHPMCARLLAEEGRMMRLANEAAKGLDQNQAEARLADSFSHLEALIKGWSRRDPKAAWHSIKDPEGCFYETALLRSYGYILPRSIFEHLARIDPEYAQSEFLAYSKVVHSEAMSGGLAKGLSNVLYQGSMVQGMSLGLPHGHDWKGLIKATLSIPRAEHQEIMQRLRGCIYARWMQDDHQAAVSWFRSEEGKVISMQVVMIDRDDGHSAPTGKKLEPVSLRFAVRHWLANEPRGATRWLKDHPEMIEEVLRKESSVDPDTLTRRDLRKVLVGTLPQKDRDALLLKQVNDGKAGRLLSEIVESSPEKQIEEDFAEVKKEIAELKVSPEIAAKVLEFRRNQPVSNNPFGD